MQRVNISGCVEELNWWNPSVRQTHGQPGSGIPLTHLEKYLYNADYTLSQYLHPQRSNLGINLLNSTHQPPALPLTLPQQMKFADLSLILIPTVVVNTTVGFCNSGKFLP